MRPRSQVFLPRYEAKAVSSLTTAVAPQMPLRQRAVVYSNDLRTPEQAVRAGRDHPDGQSAAVERTVRRR